MLGAIGLILNEQNSLNAQGTAADNLAYQKSQGENTTRMSQATKVDAYGNKQIYNPVTNTWEEELTPMQKAIQQAGESEQYKTLTQDAQRKRELAQRQEGYSQDAGAPYNAAVQGYKFDQPKSEDAINNDIQTLMINAKQNAGKENQGMLSREALRLGRGADIPALIKATNDNIGASTPSVMLNARQQALQEHQGRVSAHDQQYLPEIAAFKQIIDSGGGGASARFSDLPGQVSAAQQNSSNAMLSALSNANSGISSAAKSLSATQGKTQDFSGLIKALAANKTKGGSTDTTGNSWDSGMNYGNVSDYLNNIPQNLGMSDFIS